MTKRGQPQRFRYDNKGSAMLAVVIAMLFVVALGTALLYAAYSGLQVSATARSDESNFYDASAAMDAVKSGVQDEVAKALQLAYSEVLVEYGKGTISDPQQKFMDEFVEKLDLSEEIGGGTFTVFPEDPVFHKKKIQVSVPQLQDLATAAYDGTVSLSAAGMDESGKIEALIDESSISITGLQLNCISPKGYESNISTDIVIQLPDFFSGSAVSASLGDYTIIANQSLKALTLNQNSVLGGIYVGPGGITIGKSCKLEIDKGKLVSAGRISTEEDSSFSVSADGYDFWANEIEAGKNSTVTINSNTHVADDLILNGGSTVELTGRYYGFGSDDAETTNHDVAKSSSIFVNSYVSEKKATLDISKLEQMCIAGVSFINGTYPSGQSIAVKTDQLAYLVPAEAITNYKTNPTVLKFNEEILESPKINTATVLWTIDGVNKTLAYYIGDENVKDEVYSGASGSLVTYYAQGTDVGYVFINFTKQAKANEYFKDYFAAKPEAIQQYLDIYLDLNKYSPSLTDISKGNSYRNCGTDTSVKWENVLGTNAFPDSQAEFYTRQYTKLSQSALSTYINVDSLNELANGTELKFGGTESNPMAVVAKKDYFYNTEMSNLRVIISSGDVTINQKFNGIIIAEGAVYVNSQINYCAPSAEVLTSTTSDGVTLLSDYLNTSLFNGQGSTAENKWSPDKLVYYSNWQKE